MLRAIPEKMLRAHRPLPAVQFVEYGNALGVESDRDGVHKRATLLLNLRTEPEDIDALFAQANVMIDLGRLCLVFLFMGLSGDRSMAGRYITGVLKLLPLGGLGLWRAIDLFKLATGYAVGVEATHTRARSPPPGSFRRGRPDCGHPDSIHRAAGRPLRRVCETGSRAGPHASAATACTDGVSAWR